MVKENNGILAFDNFCNAFGSPVLATERESALLLCNYTVVGLSAFEFIERPRFKWTWVDEHVAVASLPRSIGDLRPHETNVHFRLRNIK